MSGVEQRRTVTRRELLDLRERAWSKRLRAVSLAAEYPVKEAHRTQALEALGHLYRKQPSFSRGELLVKWPAVHVLATTGVATDHYQAGTFWSKLAGLLGVYNDQAFQREWGQAFLANLRLLGLPTFENGSEDVGTTYVGRVLMHSGVPTHCLHDYFRIVTERRSRVAGLSPELFVSWAANRARDGRLYNVDKPVERFLRYGQEFAVDVTDRVFDLLDVVSAGGDGSDVPLPSRFSQVAVDLKAQGEVLGTGRRSSGAGADADQQPRLVVDPYGQGLLLRLPAVGDAPDGSAVWVVTLDAQTQRVPTRALWPGSREPAPATEVPIPSPVRMATAALQGREHLKALLSVIDDKDPMLAFGEDGSQIAPGLPLPGRPTWILFPGEPKDLLIKGDVGPITESPLPPGWAGWCLVLVDLERATHVRVGVDGKARDVRNQASARVIVGEPARGARTSAGELVYPDLPRVVLPAQLGEAKWDITILDSSGTVLVHRKAVDSEDAANEVWDELTHPLVGSFTVRVRGPWGRGVTRNVTVAEGLRVTFDPQWRPFAKSGLQPCVGRIAAPTGMTVSRDVVHLAEKDRDAYVRIGAGEKYRSLLLTPPHMTVAYQAEDMTTSPSIRPLRLFSEDVKSAPGTLILDIGAAADPTLHVLAGTQVLQDVEPGAGRNGVYRFDLSRIVDTLSVHPQTKLALSSDGQLIVATTQPRKLFRAATIHNGAIEFADCVDVEGLTALLYATRAPWRRATSLSILNGRATLPPALIDGGPLLCSVRIDDPWAPLPVPDWPPLGGSVLLPADGWITDGDEEEQKLSAFLAGVRVMPDDIRHFGRVWTVRGRLASLSLAERTAEVSRTLDETVQAHPREALLALAESPPPGEAIPSLLIQARLVWANLAAAHEDEAPAWTVRGALPAMLLAAADGEWSQEEVEAATDVCGDVVPELLAGKDGFATSGRLDAAAEVFDRIPEMREEFVRQTALVPQGLLSGDSRVIAAMALVRDRRDARLEYLNRNAHRLLVECERMLRILDDPIVQAAFDARKPPGSDGTWRVIPAISLALAFAARYAARGQQHATYWVPRQRRIWADLAAVVPDMVTIDLILAELLVSGSQRSRKSKKS